MDRLRTTEYRGKVRPAQFGNELSVEAARQVQMRVIAAVRKEKLLASILRQRVIDSTYFESLMNGKSELLVDSGLARKMRSAVLAIVDADCHPAKIVSEVSSCTVSAKVHVIKPSGEIVLSDDWNEIGPGVTDVDAITRAAELLIERHPALLSVL